MVKTRVPIPPDVAAEVLFDADRICCVCQERGKHLQIHHIDEDPSNNSKENLSVLCLECHNDTQVQGGFGRKLNADLVTKYRNDWCERVARRRSIADEMAVTRQVGAVSITEAASKSYETKFTHLSPNEPPMEYINQLPEYRKQLREVAQPKWDTGVTATVVNANYDYIDALRGILVVLLQHFSPEQFGEKSPPEYLSEIITSRFQWHRSIAQPHGPGTGGTIVNILVGSSVVEDVEKMVEDTVMALVGYDDSFDWRKRPKKWRGEI